jgi:hypothetical protein
MDAVRVGLAVIEVEAVVLDVIVLDDVMVADAV